MSDKKTDLKTQLQEANKSYTECLANDFLQKFLAGENVKVEDFCQDEYKQMISLDRNVYGNLKESLQ